MTLFLPILSCEQDIWSNFHLNLTRFRYKVGTVKISVDFVDGLSSSKSVEMFGCENFNIPIIPLELKMERKFKSGELAS